ncbi:hypothetical protein [Mesorhizobium sp. STM 4661]|uniref:hypothetical protein n=1 Tax=Mesorhizobium sp. STM 4661 TaxID=1297570 RepID=UPI0012FACBFA|nr:hypothetical protein [Mesorhizobium sp. STM 4661]
MPYADPEMKRRNARLYRLKNHEKRLLYAKGYYLANQDRLKLAAKEWKEADPLRSTASNAETYQRRKQAHLQKSREYKNRRRAVDPSFKLAAYLRSRLYKAVKGQGSAVADLGCTLLTLRIIITSLFQPGMTWQNYGEWHLDHKRPLASFDLTDRDQFLQACHYTNYQPLWAPDNLRKGAKPL